MIEDLAAVSRRAQAAGIAPDLVTDSARAAVRLVPGEGESGPGGSRLGGLPDLPQELAWPHWDPAAADAEEAERAAASAQAHPSAYLQTRATELEERMGREPLPLAFLAQLNLAELAGLPHGLPLPEAGLLSFFYELREQVWGYSPSHRGAWRILYTSPDAALERREPPETLASEHVLQGAGVRPQPIWTLPSWPPVDPGDTERFDALWGPWLDVMAEVKTGVHQVGGHPDQLQQDMRRNCALVTSGVYLGSPPDLPREELDARAAADPDWRLVLQLVGDDSLGWRWGDSGHLFWWARGADLHAQAWERAWFQLQSH